VRVVDEDLQVRGRRRAKRLLEVSRLQGEHGRVTRNAELVTMVLFGLFALTTVNW